MIYTSGVIWLQVTPDGMPEVIGTVPLRSGTALHTTSSYSLCPIEVMLLLCENTVLYVK